MGYPGSGKSFLAKQIEKKSGFKYATVCRDVLGSWQKCAAEATKIIKVNNVLAKKYLQNKFIFNNNFRKYEYLNTFL